MRSTGKLIEKLSSDLQRRPICKTSSGTRHTIAQSPRRSVLVNRIRTNAHGRAALNDQERILEGSITTAAGDVVSIAMPAVHWEGLRWLTKNEAEPGEVTALIASVLNSPERADESDSQIVAWFVEAYMEGVFGGGRT